MANKPHKLWNLVGFMVGLGIITLIFFYNQWNTLPYQRLLGLTLMSGILLFLRIFESKQEDTNGNNN